MHTYTCGDIHHSRERRSTHIYTYIGICSYIQSNRKKSLEKKREGKHAKKKERKKR